jgi:hypothetical protein
MVAILEARQSEVCGVARSKATASAGVGAAFLATVLLQATAQAADAGHAGHPASIRPAVTPNAIWGWVVARKPTTASYTPSAPNQANSSGGTNHVLRFGAGQYKVLFPGVGEAVAGAGGIVHVTALDSGTHACAAGAWTGNQDEQVAVICRDAQGRLSDAAYSVDWVDAEMDDGEMAYVRIADASTAAIDPQHSFNSTFGANTATRLGTGTYRVRFAGVDGTKGDVQVTAFGTGVACHVADWHAQSSVTVVNVECRMPTGALADARFDATYLFKLGFHGMEGPDQVYLLADQPHAASYQPAAARRFSSAGTNPTVKRTALGQYVVVLPGMPAGGAVQVTAYGTGTEACHATAIRGQTPQQVGVRCTTAGGSAVDSEFALAYTH